MKNYFEDLVSKSVDVKSFVGYFQRELIDKESGDELESPYLALFGYELGLSGPEQNTISVRKMNFAVMYKNVPPDDKELQYKAIDDAEAIILDFLARIRMDATKEGHLLYRSFQKENTNITPVELSLDAFGSEVTIEFKNNQSLKMNPNKWTDNPAIC